MSLSPALEKPTRCLHEFRVFSVSFNGHCGTADSLANSASTTYAFENVLTLTVHSPGHASPRNPEVCYPSTITASCAQPPGSSTFSLPFVSCCPRDQEDVKHVPERVPVLRSTTPTVTLDAKCHNHAAPHACGVCYPPRAVASCTGIWDSTQLHFSNLDKSFVTPYPRHQQLWSKDCI